jgi:two-component system, chemotaxis family, sensor kinase Cph1
MRKTQTRPKVLIVEDDTLTAWNLEYMIQSAGYEVVGPAGRVSEAAKLVRSSAIDAALLDIRLANNELVFPIAEMLKERSIPFAFTTAFSREMSRQSGFKDLTLLKPLDGDTVRKIIVYLTERPLEPQPRAKSHTH